MVNDKGKFTNLKNWNGDSIKFSDGASPIYGKSTIKINRKNEIDDFIYVRGLKHNILSVIKMCTENFIISHFMIKVVKLEKKSQKNV